MRILLWAIGAIGLLAATWALITTVGMKEGTRDSGLVATFALVAVTSLALILAGVLTQLEQVREELAAMRDRAAPVAKEAPDSAPPVADDAAAAAATAEREAAALMKTAEDHHFAKDFAAALAVYRVVVARFADTKAAAKAKQQIANLESIA